MLVHSRAAHLGLEKAGGTSRMATLSMTKWMNLGQAACSFTLIRGLWSFLRTMLCLRAEVYAPSRALCWDWLMQRMNWVDAVQ